jgi:hypothetical protein
MNALYFRGSFQNGRLNSVLNDPFKEEKNLDFPLLMPVQALSLFPLVLRDFGFSVLFNARHSRSFPTQGSLHTSNKI